MAEVTKSEGAQNDERKSGIRDNRWWEFYFVRYFVGTVAGALVILFLAKHTGPLIGYQVSMPEEIKVIVASATGLNATLLAAAGLAFCYIAGSPILVFHATRGLLLAKRPRSKVATTVFLISVALLTAAQVVPLWYALRSDGDPWTNVQFYVADSLLLLVSLAFVAQVFLVYFSLIGRDQAIFDYYDRLVTKRANADARKGEYIESYRHLREHGNAYLILVFELLLGGALLYASVPWSILLLLWVLPGSGIWFFGNVLESRDF